MTTPRRRNPKPYHCAACRAPVSKRTTRVCRECLMKEMHAGFEADYDKVKRLLDEGLSYSQIYKTTGVNESRIMLVMERLGIPKRARQREPAPNAVEQVCGSPACDNIVRGKKYCNEHCRKVYTNTKIKSDRAVVKRVITGEITVAQASAEIGVGEHRIRQIRKDMERGSSAKRAGYVSPRRLGEAYVESIVNGPPARIMARLMDNSDLIDWRLVKWDVP